jgi:penicillin-binding protein 1A
MPYRPNGRSWQGSPNPLHNPKRASYATRLAVARLAKRRNPRRGSAGTIVAVALVLIILLVTVLSATVIAAGGAVGLAIGTLDRDLPDVKAFRDLGFAQPTEVYDRTGKTLLASFWEQRREVVSYDEIPPLVLDVTTAVEDDTFWQNPGFDLEATVNAFAQEIGGGSERGGASTITQQLVRARLLPTEVIEQDDTQEGLYTRKAMEILQAFKLTQAYPGEEGKKAIITAYLNEIYYGQKAYGIAAAAEVYFGKDLDELSVAEAALLAGIPQRPYEWDPYNYAHREKSGKGKKAKTRLVVSPEPGRWVGRKGKPTTFTAKRARWEACKRPEADGCVPPPPVTRRAFTLRRLNEGKGRWTRLNDEQLEAALAEPIVLKPPRSVTYKAPQFVFASIAELQAILGDRDPIRRGGYKVITTLDMKAQRLGESLIQGGALLPNLSGAAFYKRLNQLHLRGNAYWINRLRGSNLHNGALVAEDYRTGEILAYVGSAGYYRKPAYCSSRDTCKFAPQVDHVGGSWRQPGSAWKPILYATGLDTGRLTAGSYLLDQQEQFGPGWTPRNADGTYRGLVRVRYALQQSLNIPAIRALQRTGPSTVRKYAVKAGFTFLNGNNRMLDQASLAGALGTVEVRPLDMTTAFGAFGNGGKVTKPRYILKVLGPNGELIYQAGRPVTKQVWKPATAYIMADILSGNTNRAVNPAWGAVFELHNTRDGSRRVMAIKTGTTNELKDYSTYGILPLPKNKKQPALAVGVWYGNSDSSSPNLGLLRYSMDNAGQTWVAFVREYMKNKPNPGFRRPKGVITSGSELYIQGTQPGGGQAVDSGSAPRVTTTTPSSNGGGGSTNGSGGTNGGGGGGGGSGMSGSGGGTNGGGGGGGGSGMSGMSGGPAPAPTCKPGSTTQPPGCTILAPG